MSPDRRNVLLLAALTAVLFFDVLFLGRGFYKGDLFVYHYPMKKVVRDLTFAEGLPHWNPMYHAGQPLAANPAYELFYPPQWLVLLPSYPFAFQLHILVHFAIAAIGMYLLLRELEVRAPAAILGAVTFAFGAPYLTLLARLPFLFAMTWVPWVLLFTHRAVVRQRVRDIALGALFFGMQALLGEPVTVMQTVALAIAYGVLRAPAPRWKAAARIAVILAWGFLIALVQLLPAADHARDSVRREGFPWIYAANWSTPPLRLVELGYPQIFRALAAEDGSQSIRHMYPFRVQPYVAEIYLGLLIFVAALAGLLRKVPGRWFVVAVLAVSIPLAFGHHAPLFKLLHDSGLSKSIRYPEKFLLSALFVLIVWGAMIVDRLGDDARLRRTAIALTIVWLVVGVFCWLTIVVPKATPTLLEARALPWHPYWAMNLARGMAVLALLFTAARGAKWWPAAAVVFALADLSFMHFADARRASRHAFDEPKAARGIAERDRYRLFHKAAWDEFDLAPLATSHLLASRETDDVMREAMFRFAPAAYGFRGVLEQDLDQTSLLSTAAYQKAADDVRKRTGLWHPFFYQSANVRWITEFLQLDEAKRRGQPIEIIDIGPHPRYWFALRLLRASEPFAMAEHIVTQETRPGDVFIDAEPFAPAPARVLRVHEEPSHVRIEVESRGEAFLVVTNTAHKYWRARLDGRHAAIIPTNLGFQGFRVPAGRHTLEMRYRNPLILPALIVSAFALLAAIALATKPGRA